MIKEDKDENKVERAGDEREAPRRQMQNAGCDFSAASIVVLVK
jgi:hypothetical protein